MQCAVECFIYRIIDTVEAVESYFKAKLSKVFVSPVSKPGHAAEMLIS
jgi:hypothetical protein